MKRFLRRCAITLGALLALVVVGTFGTWVLWNGTSIARTVSGWVSNNLHGAGGPRHQAFSIGRVRWPWLPALRSFLVGGTCPFEAWEVGIWDPDGNEVVFAPHVSGNIRVGRVAWAQILSLLPGRGTDTEIHLEDLHIEKARAIITPLPPGAPDAVAGKVNIVAAFASKKHSPQNPRSGMVLTADSAVLDDVEYTMQFPGWRAELNHARMQLTSLRYSSFQHEQRHDSPALTFDAGPVTSERGRLLLGGSFDIPLANLRATRFAGAEPERHQLVFEADTACRGAPAHISGRLTDAYSDHPGVDATLEFTGGAGLAQMLPGGGLIAGDPRGKVRFHGPFSHVILEGEAANAEFRLAGLNARSVGGRFVLDRGVLSLSDVTSQVGGGKVGGTVDIDFGKFDWKAQLRVEGVDPAALQPLVPAGQSVDEVLGGSLDGNARATGNLLVHPERVAITGIDARLKRRGRGPLPRQVTLRGGLGVARDRVRLDGFRLEGDGVSAALRGEVAPGRGTIRSEVVLQGRGLGPLLARLGLPPVASSLNARTQVSGPLLEPVIDGDLTAERVGVGDRRLPRVDAHVHFEHGTLAASRIRGKGFGDGSIDGSLSVGLFHGPFTRRLREPTLEGQVKADHLAVQELVGLPDIKGELSGKFQIGGTLAAPTGTAELELPVLTIFGDPYHGGVFRAGVRSEGLDVQEISLVRDKGGRFSGHGSVKWNGDLDVEVQPKNFPLQAIPPLRDAPVPLGGMLSGLVHLGGALGKWIPSGVIEADRIRVREFSLGDGRIDLRPDGNVVKVAGVFLRIAADPARRQRFKLRVDGWLTLTPNVAGDVTVFFEDMPLDELIPEMKQLADVKSLISGSARIHFDLAGSKADIALRLSRLLVNIAEKDEEGGASEEFSNPQGEEIVIEWDGRDYHFRQFHLRDEHVDRPGADGIPGKREHKGDLLVSGRLSPDHSDAQVKGRLDLHLLQLLAAQVFERTAGAAVADLRVLGKMTQPQLRGTLDLERAELTLRDTENGSFMLPRGQLAFDDSGVKLRGLRARVDDAEAVADGTLALGQDWKPGALGITLSGQVSATVLSWLFPEHVAETQGRFNVTLAVGGNWEAPMWRGFVETHNLAFREKKLGRDVRVRTGTAAIHNWELVVGCPGSPDFEGLEPPEGCQQLVARVDDSGDLNADGVVTLQGSVLSPGLRHVNMHVVGYNLEWGSGGVFSVTLSPDVKLTGNDKQLRLEGQVNLVTGRYYQNFEIRDFVIRPRTQESEPPFYAGIPLLEDLELDINAVSSGALFIRNNIADLHVSVPSLDISGTLAEPVLDGTVFVAPGGRFAIPLLRAEFVTDPGSIDFVAERDFPNHTPSLDIRAGTDWQDRYDMIHHINLAIRGTYKEPELNLNSNDGWDKNQVLIALATGGTPDQLRRTVTDSGRGAGGTTFADGLVKGLSNQFMRGVEDPLKQATHFDLVRLELGYDSVMIKLCPIKKPTYQLCGSGDVGFVSTSRYDARFELKLTDIFSIAAVGERIEHGVETNEDVLTRGKLHLGLKYPIF